MVRASLRCLVIILQFLLHVGCGTKRQAASSFPIYIMNKTSLTFYCILFLELGIIAFGAFGLLIVASPTLALAMDTPAPTQEVLWAAVHVPKPTATSVPVTSPTQEIHVPTLGGTRRRGQTIDDPLWATRIDDGVDHVNSYTRITV